jgi:hypothetical protein
LLQEYAQLEERVAAALGCAAVTAPVTSAGWPAISLSEGSTC